MGVGTSADGVRPHLGIGAKIAATVCALVAVLGLLNGLQLATPVGRPIGGDADRRRLLLLVVAVATVSLLLVLVAVVVRVLDRLRELTASVRRAATHGLPTAFDRVGRMPADGVPPVLEPFEVHARDELGALAGALTELQDATVSLAVEQRRREQGTAEALLALGRRNQALLAWVHAHVVALQERTADPEVMSVLFRIDRTTARAVRNAGSMLVVAGAGPVPAREASVPVADLVLSALAQVEDDVRVDLQHLEDVGVAGALAPDLVHLLAELLENATRFSPPMSRVAVAGRSARKGYRLEIVDAGIGMSATALAAANEALDRAAAAPDDARRLGLHVVARLAARHDLVVRLEPSRWGGVEAVVLLSAASVVPGTGGLLLGRSERVVDLTGQESRRAGVDR